MALTGPTGITGLSVRQWECSSCGTAHDRDTNAAVNTLLAGLGMSHGVLKPTKSEFNAAYLSEFNGAQGDLVGVHNSGSGG